MARGTIVNRPRNTVISACAQFSGVCEAGARAPPQPDRNR
ncbi:hypothetical protein SSCG_04673 [Streptomyces clavuligerus]|nr:hypothetical protein SSCG_04673 [Streptomyces clavuligerus]